jgi:hypothetical protein
MFPNIGLQGLAVSVEPDLDQGLIIGYLKSGSVLLPSSLLSGQRKLCMGSGT